MAAFRSRAEDRGIGVAVDPEGSTELYWIPLGAGTRIVMASGIAYEWAAARMRGRRPCALYHSALVVWLPEGHYMIEQAPVPDAHGRDRGVVATGPVGLRSAGRFRIFRYEVRCWLNGVIADLGRATSGPIRVSDDLGDARRLLAVLPSVPTPTWGRDQLHTGEMWNSNSVVAWALSRSGIDLAPLTPPSRRAGTGLGSGHRGRPTGEPLDRVESVRRGPPGRSRRFGEGATPIADLTFRRWSVRRAGSRPGDGR